MAYQDYVMSVIDVSGHEQEPFCPFGNAFCDAAYSGRCFYCDVSETNYLIEDIASK